MTVEPYDSESPFCLICIPFLGGFFAKVMELQFNIMKEPGSYPYLPHPTIHGIIGKTNAIPNMVVLGESFFLAFYTCIKTFMHNNIEFSFDSIFYIPY